MEAYFIVGLLFNAAVAALVWALLDEKLNKVLKKLDEMGEQEKNDN